MQVATIVPIPYLELTKDRPFFMCLAHLAKAHPEYAAFFKARSDEGKFVLMDNGAAENAGLPIEDLLDLAHIVGASEMVLPDVLFDGRETIAKTVRGLRMAQDLGYKGQYMVVPQGKTYKEWADTAQELMQLPVHTIGVSKFITLRLGKLARMTAMALLNEMGATQQVHLLGCAYTPMEVAAVNSLHPVRSVDSALAYVYARQNCHLRYAVAANIARNQDEIDFQDKLTDPTMIESNQSVWEDICNERMHKLLL